MAILSGCPGVEVCVQSVDDGGAQDLQEYDDDGGWTYRKYSHLPEGQRISKYVESKAGAQFRIRIILKNPFRLTSQSVTFKASVDGHGIAQASCTADYFYRASGYYMELITARLDRISGTEITSRPLKFNNLKKVDDTDSTRVRQDSRAVIGIGEIVISVFRTLQRDPILPPPLYRSTVYNPIEEVAEKALKGKAISHGVAYGEQQIVTRHIKETVDVDGYNNPLGVFIFKYRSMEDLKIELIIPRSPSPQPAIAPLNLRGNLPAARRERLANLKREIEEIKAEEEDSQPSGSKRRRTGAAGSSGRAYKTSWTATGQVVVDLTDD
ncbi:uncharacterized protein LY89DRAFT_776627 [Mollisia scopiformis]|uniref:DUF7918 domain-containing protein n=1 Tax=Mollisia scopiformis TaxID=149040 RepID=A0A194XWM3_MOLSC|nr:uncharacterized protein LY89DRAFT_776627 [Mollisia scopiformis]KUJ24531.1 hypothetical protein LY89DRAFT_776627 [Mollisia scopiformis]